MAVKQLKGRSKNYTPYTQDEEAKLALGVGGSAGQEAEESADAPEAQIALEEISEDMQALQEVYDKFVDAMADHKADEIEKELQERIEAQNQQEQEAKDAEAQEQKEQAEQEQQDENSEGEGGDDDEPKCTKAERAMLDNFIAVQKAGSLLGMVVTTGHVEGVNQINFQIMPAMVKDPPAGEDSSPVVRLFMKRMEDYVVSIHEVYKENDINAKTII